MLKIHEYLWHCSFTHYLNIMKHIRLGRQACRILHDTHRICDGSKIMLYAFAFCSFYFNRSPASPSPYSDVFHTILTKCKYWRISTFHVEKPSTFSSFSNVKDRRKKRKMQCLESIHCGLQTYYRHGDKIINKKYDVNETWTCAPTLQASMLPTEVLQKTWHSVLY
jgi:hypothetical protein